MGHTPAVKKDMLHTSVLLQEQSKLSFLSLSVLNDSQNFLLHEK